MARATAPTGTPDEWTAVPDPESRYSSGIPDFDRLTGGGFARGSFALLRLDATIGTDELDLFLTPLFLNFLYQSRGILAVLPSRDAPHAFRARLTRYATRRRFDSRVRVVTYVGEDEELPYVVHLKTGRRGSTKAENERVRAESMAKMVTAGKAASGERKRPFLELNAFEVPEMLFGAETASRMFFHGIKRARMVQNLVLGLARPGLQCSPAVEAMADSEFALSKAPVGLTVRGIRPAFGTHVVTVDRARGAPHVSLVPGPPSEPR
jgi:GvpD gas vesicle protein